MLFKLLLLIPAIIGLIVAILNKTSINNSSENIENWIKRKQKEYSQSNNKILSLVFSPIFWVAIKLSNWTDAFKHRGLKNGVRITIILYSILILLAATIYAAIWVVMIIVVLWIGWFAIKLALGISSDPPVTPIEYDDKGRVKLKSKDLWSGEMKSESIYNDKQPQQTNEKGVFGNEYTQYYDKNGVKTGYSQEETEFLGGKFIQHYDNKGNKTVKSQKSELLQDSKGDYIQHYDENGKKIGVSRKQKDAFGQEYLETQWGNDFFDSVTTDHSDF